MGREAAYQEKMLTPSGAYVLSHSSFFSLFYNMRFAFPKDEGCKRQNLQAVPSPSIFRLSENANWHIIYVLRNTYSWRFRGDSWLAQHFVHEALARDPSHLVFDVSVIAVCNIHLPSTGCCLMLDRFFSGLRMSESNLTVLLPIRQKPGYY